MHKRFLSVITAAAVLTLSVSMGGCSQAKKDNEDTAQEETKLVVDVTSPTKGNISVSGDFAGELEFGDEVTVYPKISGEVTATYFEEGDFVSEGDLMFTLDDEAYQMTLKNAQAVYDTTKAGNDQKLGALQMNRDSAVNSLITAGEGIASAENTYGHYQSQYGDLVEKKDDILDDINDLKDDKKSTKKKYNKAKKALRLAKEAGASDDEITELKTAVTTLRTALDGIEKGIDSYEDAIDQVESSQETLEFQMKNLGYTWEQAKRGTALAQEAVDYYDAYTVPGAIEVADASLRQAQVGIDSAKLQIENTQVTAPVSGFVKKKNVDKFDMAQAGSECYVITNDASLVATFEVPESTCKMFAPGQEVLAERNGNEYKGVITEIPANVDPDSGLFKVKATIIDTKGDLSTGTSVKITTTTSHADNVLMVPVDCVYYSSGEAFVYAVENGVVRQVFVSTGLYNDEMIEITDGLDAQMEVITVWSSDLRDGLEVEVAGKE